MTSGQEGDELHAFGEAAPDRQPHFSLYTRIVQLVPGTLIVLAWKNMVWNSALDPSEITDLDSTVVSHDEWLAARIALLAKEKEFTRQRE